MKVKAKSKTKTPRTPKQKAAIKRLVALNKKRRNPTRKKRRSVKSRKRRPARKKYTKRRAPIMAKRKRKRSYKRKRKSPRSYTRRRNPNGFNFFDLIQQSVIAGVGGMSVLMLGNFIQNAFKMKSTLANRGFIRLLITIAGAVFLPNVLKKSQSDAFISGGMAIVWVTMFKNFLPKGARDFMVLGQDEEMEYLVEDVLGQNEDLYIPELDTSMYTGMAKELEGFGMTEAEIGMTEQEIGMTEAEIGISDAEIDGYY